MPTVTVRNDLGVKEENNEMVPAGSPREGGMMVRRLEISYEGDLLDIENELTDVTSSSSPKTYIQSSDTDYNEKTTTIRVCVDSET
jgi:hypothetical protein